MGKLHNIMRLLDLLSTRKSVSVKSIKEIVGLQERTVYRYLKTLSESNVPIYYDRSERAYKLEEPSPVWTDDLTLEDATIVVCALRVFSGKLGNQYRETIENLLNKLMIRVGFPIEEFIPTIDECLAREDETVAYSELLSTVLVQAAVILNKKVRLHIDGGGGSVKVEDLQEPRLVFERHWMVTGASRADSQTVPVADIVKSEIL